MEWRFVHLIEDNVSVVKIMPHEGFIYSNSNCLSEIFWTFCNSPMGLLNLLVMNLKFFPKFNLSSKNTPRCFWHGVFAVSNNDISRKCNSCQRSFLEKRRVNQYFQSCLGAKSKDWTVYEKQPPDTEESLDKCQLRGN